MASERAKISPDLVHHIMQYAWELRVAETPAGADGDTTSSAKKKFPVKDEAVVATAEVLRLFAEEITARAAETRLWTETTPWMEGTWSGFCRSSCWTSRREKEGEFKVGTQNLA